ncbi:hypothetical protein WUBG_15368, partial [Wuchereria bancrofti]
SYIWSRVGKEDVWAEVDDGQMKGQDKIAVATAQIMMKEGDSQFSSSSTVVVSDTYPISILM